VFPIHSLNLNKGDNLIASQTTNLVCITSREP
jgi:hypothetical protein